MTIVLHRPPIFFRTLRSRIALAFSLAALALIAATAAQACACCTQTAWRRVELEKLDAAKLAEIAQVKFAKAAQLMLGEADQDAIKGVKDPEEDYELGVTRAKERWAFSFRDKKGRAGTLTLALPKAVSIFEVDPRHGKDEGQGPVLYKEWKLTANAAGDGLFRAATGGNQKMILVLHGRGNGCTSAEDFTHWTLLVHGPVDTFTMYGKLDRGAP
jgi:hypothetical protein